MFFTIMNYFWLQTASSNDYVVDTSGLNPFMAFVFAVPTVSFLYFPFLHLFADFYTVPFKKHPPTTNPTRESHHFHPSHSCMSKQ